MRVLASGVLVALVLSAVSCDLFSRKTDEAAQAAGAAATEAAAKVPEAVWLVLFDGKSLEGWKINENPASWSVKDGCIVANGERSNLFYVGTAEPFADFELEAVVMTKPNSNSGMYIHTQYQDSGWPKYGFEVQVNNSFGDPQKTASLYEVKKITEAPAKDDVWFTMRVRVEGKHIQVDVDGKTVTDYTEPEGTKPGADFTRVVDMGTFALQAHDPGSTVLYKSLRVRRLP